MWASVGWAGKFLSNFKSYYNEINSATLTGAIDILVVEQPDGTFQSSPFHVRFGKLGVMRSREKVVYLEINGEPIRDLHMKLGESGEAFFVQEVLDQWEGPEHLATSPIPASPASSSTGLKRTMSDTALPAAASLKKAANRAVAARRYAKETDRHSSSSSSSSCSDILKKVETSQFKPISHEDDEMLESGGMFDIEVSDDESKLQVPDMHIGMSKTVSLPVIKESSKKRTEKWTNNPYHSAQFHPFSDTDITPLNSPVGSRPHTPKSDTEFELPRKPMTSGVVEGEDDIHWSWGELPESPSPSAAVKTENVSSTPTAHENESGGLLSFMRSTKKLRHKPEEGGIYLDDLNLQDMDPEVAALYFPNKKNVEEEVPTRIAQANEVGDEDVESGNGESLPHSPSLHPERVLNSPTSDTGTVQEHDQGIFGDIAISACGGLAENGNDLPAEHFQQFLLTYPEFSKNPQILQNPSIVVRIGGKWTYHRKSIIQAHWNIFMAHGYRSLVIGKRYYNWVTAAPMVMSMVCFQSTLPENVQDDLVKSLMPVKARKSSRRSWWPFYGSKPEQVDVESGIPIPNSNNSTPDASPKKKRQISSTSQKSDKHHRPKKRSSKPIILINSEEDDSDTENEKTTPKSIPISKPLTIDTNESKEHSHQSERFKKTLRLSSEQLSQLHLQEGANEIEFSVTTSLQGTTRCTAQIFLWKHTDRIVVSDIDGTITRSDVLGQVLPMIGKDWSQSGVTELYNNIASNGYKTIYLSARAIGQAPMTRAYLDSVKQGELTLPPGPLFLSPSSLINAFHKEVIEKKPEEFKISCLNDIKSLFSGPHALYAGFGNKVNDMYAYTAVGITKERIFLIDPSGQVKSEYSQTFRSTYSHLSEVTDYYFPPLKEVGHVGSHFHSPGKYSNFTYWREPLPEISLEELV